MLNGRYWPRRSRRFTVSVSTARVLQQYFDERYWYAPAAEYNPKSISDIERKTCS